MSIHIFSRTGPKSLPGKDRSSLNALKHGGYVKIKILPLEDEAEYNKLRRDVYKALKLADIIQKNLANQIVDSLWRVERCVPFASDYLLNPNHKIAKKDVHDAGIVVYQYKQFSKNAKGMSNYNSVWRQYPELFKGAHIWSERFLDIPFFMSHGKDLSIEWQNQPETVLKLLHKFAALMYFKSKFNQYKPKIRVMMASWLFLQKQQLRNSNQHDDFIMKERRVYQSFLGSYMKLRNSQDEHMMFLNRLKIQPEVVVLEDPEGNEMTDSNSESST